MKVLSPTPTEDREFRDRFMRETPIATTLYHPHILEVEYRGETDGLLWVTMDYVNGMPRLGITQRCEHVFAARQVIEAVHEHHRPGIS